MTKLQKFSFSFTVIAWAFMTLLWSYERGEHSHYQDLYDKTSKQLQDTTYALNLTRQDQVKWFELREMVERVRGQGFAPDSLVVWTIVDIREQFPAVGTLVDSVAQYESSWGYNKKNGLIGEKGWCQYRPETFAMIAYGLGADSVGLHQWAYDHPLDVRSTTEFFYATATIFRMLNDGAFYQNWNRGMFAKIKKRKNHKPVKVARYSIIDTKLD